MKFPFNQEYYAEKAKELLNFMTRLSTPTAELTKNWVEEFAAEEARIVKQKKTSLAWTQEFSQSEAAKTETMVEEYVAAEVNPRKRTHEGRLAAPVSTPFGVATSSLNPDVAERFEIDLEALTVEDLTSSSSSAPLAALPHENAPRRGGVDAATAVACAPRPGDALGNALRNIALELPGLEHVLTLTPFRSLFGRQKPPTGRKQARTSRSPWREGPAPLRGSVSQSPFAKL